MASLIQSIMSHTRHDDIKNYIKSTARNTHTEFYRSRINLQTIYNYADFTALFNLTLSNTFSNPLSVYYNTECPGEMSELRNLLRSTAQPTSTVDYRYCYLYNCANSPAVYNYYKFAVQSALADGLLISSTIETTTYTRPDGSLAEVEYILYLECDQVLCITSVYNSEIADKLISIMMYKLAYKTTTLEDANYLRIIDNLWEAALFNQDNVEAIQELDAYYETNHMQVKLDAARKELDDRLQKLADAKLDTDRAFNASIQRKKDEIDAKERQLRALYSELRKIQLEHYVASLSTQNDVIKDFTRMLQTLINRGIVQELEVIKDSNMLRRIALTIETPITFWEEDEADAYLKYLSNTGNRIKTYIFKKIFVDQEVTLYTRTKVMLDIKDTGITVLTPDIPAAATEHPYTLTLHPHVGWFTCFGDNKSSITKCLSSNDLAGAFGYVMNSLTQMNLADYVVTGALMDNLVGRNLRSCSPWHTKSLEYKGAQLTGETLYKVLFTELEGGHE